MGEMIITKDGKREFVERDLHFQDLLRKYIGDDAADYYHNRIEEMESILDELKSLVDTRLNLQCLDEAILILNEDVDKVRWDA